MSPNTILYPLNKKIKMRKEVLFKFFIMIFLLHANGFIKAQSISKELSLKDAINRTLENNKDILLSELDEKIASAKYKQTDAIFLPQLSLSSTAVVTDNPLNAFGMKLQQKSITQNDFNPQLLNHPSGTWDFMTAIQVQQPIINMDRLYERKSAFKQTELYQFKTQRTQQYILFQVKQAYMQLQLAHESKTVLEESLKTVNAIYKFTNDRYNAGLLQKSNLLNVELQVKIIETNISDAESAIKNSSDYLSLLMNLPAGTIYKTESFPSLTNAVSVTTILPEDRLDFKAMETAIQSYDLMIKSSEMAYLPRLNAFGAYQLNDKNIAGFGANSYLAGIQLSWDLFKGNQTKNKISTQTFERNKLQEELLKQKQESDIELQKTQRLYLNAKLKIARQKLAVELADESLRILQNRYTQGLENTTDVLTAQTQLSQQQLIYQQTLFEANVTAAYLEFLTAQ